MACVEQVDPISEEHVLPSNDIILEHAYSGDQEKKIIEQNDPVETMSTSSSSPDDSVDMEVLNTSKSVEIEPQIEIKDEDVKTESVPESKVKSRELKSLLDAVKESNLDTNIAYKRRTSSEPNASQESGGKRAMRSQNPDFVARHKKFLHKVNKFDMTSHGAVNEKNESDKDNASLPKTPKRKKENFDDDAVGGSSVEDVKKSRKSLKVDILNINMKKDKDNFCWRCHRDGILIQCETCPRGYHPRCLKQPVHNPDRWPCPECLAIIQAESTKTRSPAMRDMSLEHLCELLKYAAKRMINCVGSEPFIHPVDLKAFADYQNYVVQPMDLTTLQNNIRNNVYGSTVAFMADAKWILHNSIIYNSYQSKLTTAAKSIVKICKQEMSEIETCSECYQNANTKKNSWFVEVCSKPHILLWAKLKGFPYWPAKAMTTNSAGLVDVRFFGAHDRAWIPVKECFLYSKKDPNTTNKNKRNNIAECIKEVDIHIEKLKEKFGEFYHAPYRTPYDPGTELEQLAFMLPKYIPSSKIKSPLMLVKSMSTANGEEDIKPINKRSNTLESKTYRKRSKSRTRSKSFTGSNQDDKPKSRASSEIRSDFGDDMETLTSSSKTSIASDEKNDKFGLKFSPDFEKFMEGYGTEDDDSILLDDEARKNIINYDSSDEESTHKANIDDVKNGNDHDDDDKTENITETAILSRGKVRTRGGYHNVTGKVKVLSRKRNSTNSPTLMESPAKLPRRNSDISTKSDSSRVSSISDKINRVEEFSAMLEVSIGNTSKDGISSSDSSSPDKKSRPEFIPTLNKAELSKLKPVIQVNTGDLYTKNKEFRISPQNKPSGSIADRLMKKITESELTSEAEKIESVKKQILDNLESSTSSEIKDTQSNEDVSSSDNTVTEKSVPEKNNEVSKEILTNNEPSTSHSNNDMSDKNQNVSSSTESTSIEIVISDKSKKNCDAGNNDTIDKPQEKPITDDVKEVEGNKKKSIFEESSNIEKDKDEILNKVVDKSKEKDTSKVKTIVIKKLTEKEGTNKEKENTIKENTIKENTNSPKENPKLLKEKEAANIIEVNKIVSVKDKENSTMEIVSSLNKEYSKKDKLNSIKDNPINNSDSSTKETSVKEKEISSDSVQEKENAVKVKNSSLQEENNTLPITDPKLSSRSVRAVKGKIYEQMDLDSEEEEETSDEEDTSDDEESSSTEKINKIVKIVNVSDILAGKISSSTEKSEPTSTFSSNPKPAESINIMTEPIEIKSEPQSEDEESEGDNRKSTEKPIYDVTLTVVDKQKKTKNEEIMETTKAGFKVVDNMTRIIDSVASNYSKEFEKISKNTPIGINRKEITLKPISKLMMSPKQKARKSFPNSPHKMQQVPLTTIKKGIPEKREILPKPISNVSLKVVSTLQSVPSQISSTTTTTTVSTTATTSNKDNMVVVAPPQTTPVMNNMAILPPNQPITLTQNVGNSILAMVHPSINNSSLIIQQTSTIPSSTQITATNSQCSIVTPSLDTCTSTTSLFPQPQATEQIIQPSVTDGTLPESISKAVGDLLCKPPPKLKPRPPGPLSNHYDEGSPSSAGPTTNLINSISHRLTDYFRGLLKETLNDLSSIGDPESRIRSLEIELETVKHKHAEEMLELRKNISSILKDIQKSIVEEKAKIVDETRAACEAERLRCVEEAKSKQWCAFCYKEAQFYCCWNTSYCDYPCQQKHWATHMKTCSQTTVRNVPPAPSSTTASSTTDKTAVNTPNKPKQTYSNPNKTVLKSTRMIVKQTNKQGVPMYVPVQRPLSGNQQTITLVESTPGNFEIVGNHGPISLGGKLVPTTTIKVKPGNLITVASTASNNTLTTGSGTQKTIILSQKAPQVASKSTSENKT